MVARPIRIRRGRRTDFTAVLQLLAGSGAAIPPPDRTALRRFRQLVADLGGDLYLATIDERIVGMAHVTYARQLAEAPRATLSTLVVEASQRRRGIGTQLLRFAAARARQRACARLHCTVVNDGTGPAADFLHHAGARPAGMQFEVSLFSEH